MKPSLLEAVSRKREPRDTIEKEHRKLKSHPELKPLFQLPAGFTAIVNNDRQILYTNQEQEQNPEWQAQLQNSQQKVWSDQLKKSSQDIHGQRFGEVMTCINSGTDPGGCGCSEACEQCGINEALMMCIEEREKSSKDVEITLKKDHVVFPVHYRIMTMPFSLQDREYTILHVEDISNQKRKNDLERFFYHDILNTVTAMGFSIDQLSYFLKDTEGQDVLRKLDVMNRTLGDEIQSQKLMARAENGSLQVSTDLLDTGDLLSQVKDHFQETTLGRTHTLQIDSSAAEVSLISDHSILQRVLINMVKNGLEAEPEGETILLNCRVDQDLVVFEVFNPTVIPELVQRSIFQQSISTKGEGHGLGLMSIRMLTEGYLRGVSSFTSTLEDGTCFRITLPKTILVKS